MQSLVVLGTVQKVHEDCEIREHLMNFSAPLESKVWTTFGLKVTKYKMATY